MTAAREANDLALRESDRRARELSQRIFDRPLVVEAGAGTGKTTALVARVLAWCLGVGWDRCEARLAGEDERGADRVACEVLERVVAITFTEKAAAEMSQRVGEALRGVERGEVPAWLSDEVLPNDSGVCRTRARSLIAALDRLVVATIHAYCRRILSENALDAGLHPNLEVDADGDVQAEIVREVLDRTLEQAYTESGDPVFLQLAERGIGPRELERELLALLDTGTAAAAFAADPVSSDRVIELCQRFGTALEAVDAWVHPLAQDSGIGGAAAIRVRETLEWLRSNAPTHRHRLEEFVAWLRQNWLDNEKKRVADWAKGRFNRRETDSLGIAICQDPATAASAARAHRTLVHLIAIDLERLELARAALVPLLSTTETLLRQRGVATFSALLCETRELLRSNRRVAENIRAGIDQLLVDEFQDTDMRQCDIIRSLALNGEALNEEALNEEALNEEGLDGDASDGSGRDDSASSRPGLFLVGDPKQSIYGWRNADLAAYDAFIDDVLAAGGCRERLSVNHRSVPAILDEVERIIAPAMQPQRGLQPAFQKLIPCPANAGPTAAGADRRTAGTAVVEHWVSAAWDADTVQPIKTRSNEATRIEATALARDLRSLHDRDQVGWASIGVLFRSRGDWEIYLSALRDADIPYVVEGDRSYYRRREIIEVASLLRTVLDPNDPLALLTLLRSSLVGVPDAALIPLWSRDFPARVGALETFCPDRLSELANLIRDAARAVPETIPGIDRIRGWEQNLIGIVTDIAVLRESFASDASDVFVEKLRTRSLFEATEATLFLGAWRCANLDRFFRELIDALADGGDTQVLLRRLRRAVASEEDAEEGRPVEIVDDAVAVMTIHGAKGLDFDHVYLMQLHKGAAPAVGTDCGASEHAGRFEYRLCGASTLGWDRVDLERERVSEAERVRTLYVAMTRAKQRLVLAGVWPAFQQRSGAGQPIELVEPRFDGDLRVRMTELAASGRVGFLDRFGVRFSLPAIELESPTQASLLTVRGVSLPSEAEIARASARLDGMRADANSRMRRPVGSAASAQVHADDAAERDGIGSTGGSSPWAREIGTAIHRVLEEFDYASARDASELERQRASLAIHLASIVPRRFVEAAVAEASELLDRIAAGMLFGRLVELSDWVLARELPVLCGPDAEENPGAPPTADPGPVGYYAGTIDLVYRDPETAEIVIADYKTDSFERDSFETGSFETGSFEPRVAAYRRQGSVYQHALKAAMGLARLPRFELWFFHPDRIL